MALAPALVPIAGAATVGIVAFGAGLASAAGAAAVAVLAFQGVGDALKAVNDFSLEPTAEGFEKMQAAMDQLGPAGQDFVTFLQEMRPQIHQLQDLAQAGLFPGLTEGLDELTANMPIAERFVSNFADTMGELAGDAGDRLNDPWWQDFFSYISTSGPQILSNFTRATGNVVEGLAGMLQAFDPLTQGFSEGLLGMSRDFAAWGRGLSETQGFQNFIDYIRETGPQVLATLGSLGGALVELVQAAAPIGGVALKGLELIGDAIGAVADSSVGPGLIAAAAGLAALSRGIALFNAANGSALAGLFGSSGSLTRGLPAASSAFTLFGSSVGAASKQLGTFGPTLKSSAVGGSFQKLAKYVGSASTATGAFTKVSTRLKTALTGAAPAVAGVAGALLLMDRSSRDSADSLGDLESIAGGALLGFAVGGPIGAAIGGGAGLLLELATASDAVQDGLTGVRTSLSSTPSDFEGTFTQIENTTGAIEDLKAAAASTPSGKAVGAGLFATREIAAASDELEQLSAGAVASRQAMSDLSKATGGGAIDTSDLEALTTSAEQLAPAFEQAGYSLDALLAAKALAVNVGGDDTFAGSLIGDFAEAGMDQAVADLEAFVRQTDSVAGQTKTATDAFFGLSASALTAGQSAEAWVQRCRPSVVTTSRLIVPRWRTRSRWILLARRSTRLAG